MNRKVILIQLCYQGLQIQICYLLFCILLRLMDYCHFDFFGFIDFTFYRQLFTKDLYMFVLTTASFRLGSYCLYYMWPIYQKIIPAYASIVSIDNVQSNACVSFWDILGWYTLYFTLYLCLNCIKMHNRQHYSMQLCEKKEYIPSRLTYSTLQAFCCIHMGHMFSSMIQRLCSMNLALSVLAEKSCLQVSFAVCYVLLLVSQFHYHI